MSGVCIVCGYQWKAALAERDAALEYANLRIDNQMTLLADRDAAIAELVEALEWAMQYVPKHNFSFSDANLLMVSNVRSLLSKYKEPS